MAEKLVAGAKAKAEAAGAAVAAKAAAAQAAAYHSRNNHCSPVQYYRSLMLINEIMYKRKKTVLQNKGT